MKYLLDSNAWIDCLKRPAAEVARRLATHPPGDIGCCSVVRAELYFGALRSNDPRKRWFEASAFLAPYASLPFDDKAAEVHGEIRADLTTKGMIIGPNDLMIAAIARANGLTLVTHNTAEFSRVPGLLLEDWQAPLPSALP